MEGNYRGGMGVYNGDCRGGMRVYVNSTFKLQILGEEWGFIGGQWGELWERNVEL